METSSDQKRKETNERGSDLREGKKCKNSQKNKIEGNQTKNFRAISRWNILFWSFNGCFTINFQSNKTCSHEFFNKKDSKSKKRFKFSRTKTNRNNDIPAILRDAQKSAKEG